MKVISRIEEIETKMQSEIHDITDNVIDFINKSGISSGFIIIQAMHTTVGVYLNESEKFLFEDFIRYLEECAPQIKNKYRHDNIPERDCPPDEPENGHAHIKSALFSNSSIVLPIFDKKLIIGKYQRILFAEFDGPCPRKHKTKRKYYLQIIGE